MTYAIPEDMSYSVDPVLDDDSFVYLSGVEENEGERKSYGYLLNLTSESTYEYDIWVDDVSEGFEFESVDSSIEMDITALHSSGEEDYQVFNATDLNLRDKDIAKFEVMDWSLLNSTEDASIRVELYEEGETEPYETYDLTNDQRGFEPEEDPDDPDDEDDDDLLLWILPIIAVIVIALLLVIFFMRKKGEDQEDQQPPRQQPQQRSEQPPPQQQPQQQQSQEPQQQTQQRSEPSPPPQERTTRTCPTCGEKLRYIDEYDRWYCDNCQEYK